MPTPQLAIVIPCYNESDRLNLAEFAAYLTENSTACLIFVNDGSGDDTLVLLKQFREQFPANIRILNFAENQGKAKAVSAGMSAALQMENIDYMGYLDADLSTSFQEYERIFRVIRYDNAQYGFGSRVKMKNTRILRRGYRHVIGRVLTTLIDIRFQLGIYDTQCGAKIFDKNTAQLVFSDPFVSSWLFDVEVFLRLRNVDPVVSGLEIPLLEWREKKGSKLNTLTAWKIMKELFKIYSSYK